MSCTHPEQRSDEHQNVRCLRCGEITHRAEDRWKVPVRLAQAIASYASMRPDVFMPTMVHDKCDLFSAEFLGFITSTTDFDAAIVSGFKIKEGTTNVIEVGHQAVRVRNVVVDWTIRQFYPDAPVPALTPFAVWRRDWPSLETLES